MTDEEYARSPAWQGYNQYRPPPAWQGYNQRPYDTCYDQPRPTVSYALRLSDEDVARIADAVVLRLRADTTAAVTRARRPSWRKFWRGLGALLDFGPYMPRMRP